ncbi:MAG: LCP family protein [Acidimicrobiia bacterium]|nr:LCP family protein [Acidimicrobiia bacterium]
MIRRAVMVSIGLLMSLALALSGLTAAWLAGVKIPFASGATYMKIEKVGSAHFAGEPEDTVFILLVGNDYRPEVGGARGDALHVVGVNPALGQATIINIPRDTCAYVPGSGTTKINAAHALGGPKLQAEVLGTLLGVSIPYAVSVDFAGFQGIVDGAGGVTVDVPTAMSDHYSGAYFEAGEVHMNGSQALAFSRDRHDFATGDIQRSWNQGYLILSAIGQLQEQAKDTAGRFELLALLGRHAQLDGVGLADLYRLGRLAYEIDTDQVKNVTLPVGSGGCSGGLTPNGDAPGLLADFADDGVLQDH